MENGGSHRRRPLRQGRRRWRTVIESLESRILLAGNPDLSQLKSSIDSTFQQANSLIQTTVGYQSLPIIGSQIASDVNTPLKNLQTEFDNALGSITSTSVATQVQTALQMALGTGATVSIIQNNVNGTDEFSVTQTVTAAQVALGTPLNFNLGLPALNIKGTVGLNLSLGYTYSLDFGVDSTSVFFISTNASKTSFTFNPQITIAAGSFLDGTFGPLGLTAADYVGDPQSLGIAPTNLGLTLTTTLNAPGGSSTLIPTTIPSATANVILAGDAHLALMATLGAAGSNSAEFPSFSTVFTLDWNLGTVNLISSNSSSDMPMSSLGSTPEIGFNNISLDLGTAINNLIGPFVDDLYSVLKPIKPIVDFIEEPMPIFNSIGPLKSLIGTSDVDGQQVCTVGDFFGFLATLEGGTEAEDAFQGLNDFCTFVENFYSLYNAINGLSGTGEINLGSYTIGSKAGDTVQGDARNPSQFESLNFSNIASDIGGGGVQGELQNALNDVPGGSDLINSVFPTSSVSSEPPPNATFGSSGQYSFDQNTADYGFQFPIFTSPGSILGLFLGQTVNLFTFTTPPVDFGVPFQVNIPIFGPLVVDLRGDLDNNNDAVLFGAQFSMGYDTYGLTDGNPLDGFYINEADSFVGLGFGIAADAALDLVLVEAGVGGGIQANIALGLNPTGVTNGKLRYSQMEEDLRLGPLGLFDFGGDLTASLNAFVEIGISPFDIEKSVNFGSVTLLDFNFTAQPPVLGVENATGTVTLYLTPGNEDSSGSTAGEDNFTISDLGQDTTTGSGEFIDVNGAGGDNIFPNPTSGMPGVTDIVGAAEGTPVNLYIKPGVTSSVDIAGGYFPGTADSVPTTNTLDIDDQGSGPAIVYASDGNDQIHIENSAAMIYAGDDTTDGESPPKDLIQLGDPISGNGTSYIYGGTAYETLDGGGGNDSIMVGNSANAVVDGGGGNNTIVGGTGSDLFVDNFGDNAQDVITANPAGTNELEIDGAGGGESITASEYQSGILVTSVDGSDMDSVTATGIDSLDIEPAPGLSISSLDASGSGEDSSVNYPTPAPGTILITIDNLNGSGLKNLYIDMLGSTTGADQVNPIDVVVMGLGNDSVTFLGINTEVSGPNNPAAELYQINSANTDGGLTIFTTDGPGDSLTYDAGVGSNSISLNNSIVNPGDILFNSLANSSGTDTYDVTAAVGDVTINQDGKNINVTLGNATAGGLSTIKAPVTIGGAVVNSSSPSGYQGTINLTVTDATGTIGGTGNIDTGSMTGFDLLDPITWIFLTSLDVILGNFGNVANVNLSSPNLVTIQAGNGGDMILATPSTVPMNLLGGNGNDTIVASSNGDYITGGAGNDSISEGVGTSHGGSDTIIGGNGSNTIVDDGGYGLIYGNDTSADSATGNNLITGTASALVFTGPGMDTVHFTGAASVTILAGGGNDQITVGDGTDSINGSSGSDNIVAGNGNDTIFATNGNDNVSVGNGNNTIQLGNGNDSVFAGNGNSTILAGNGNDNITVGTGNDTIQVGSGADSILGGKGNNVVYPGSGAETIQLGDGINLIAAGLGTDHVTVGNGNDKIYGDTGGATIVAGSGQDIIYGGPGNDSISVGGGNDFINPGTGTDAVNGGTGRTVLSISADANQILTNGAVNLGPLGTITFSNIATVALNGGPSNNNFDVSGWTSPSPVQITGGGGSDTISATDDTNFTLTDTSLKRSDGTSFAMNGIGSANLTGGPSDNSIDVTGWTGGGTLTGNGGNDTIVSSNLTTATLSNTLLTRSGRGNLTLSGFAQANLTGYLTGGANINASAFTGQSALLGQGNNNTLVGGSGSDYIVGGSGSNNQLTANGTVDNQVIGGSGSSDSITGGAGQNLLVGSNGGHDLITTGSGASHVYTPGGNDSVNAQSGGAIVYAFGGNDTVNTGGSMTDQVLHPGDAGTVASDFVAPESSTFTIPPLPAAPAPTLPSGPNTSGQWVEYAQSASGGGVSNSPDAAIEPSIVVSGSGASADEYVAWADDRSGVYEIYVAEHTSSGWVQLANSAQAFGISNSTGNSTQPSITLNSSGQPVVAWTEITGTATDIYAAQYTGSAWQAAGPSLSAGGLSNTGVAAHPQIVNTGSGLVVAWLNGSNIYARRFDGTNWDPLGTGSTSGEGISQSATAVPNFSLATDGTNVAVAWSESGTEAGESVYLLQYNGSSWAALFGSNYGNGISGSQTTDSAPSAAYANGTLYAAWAANTDGTFNIVAAGYTSGSWNPVSIQTPASAGINQVSRGEASNPVLSSNGTSVDLAWVEDRLPGTPDEAVAIYDDRLKSGSFQYQLPGDSSYDGILGRSTSLSQPVTLDVALDSAGNPFVTWGDSSSGSSQVYSLADTLSVNQVIYVNGTFSVTDVYTTASGSTSNNGLTPATPMATIQQALNLASIAAGDVILVDNGSYAGFTATAADNGVLIVGSPVGSTIVTGSVTLNSDQNVTLEGLTLSGGATVLGGSGIDFVNDRGGAIALNGASNAVVSHDTFAGATLSGSTSGASVLDSSIQSPGLTLSGSTSNLLVTEDNLFSLALSATAQGTITGNNINGGGLAINAAFTGSIDHNLIHGATVGVVYAAAALLNANEIYANTTGVTASVNSSSSGLGFVAGSVPNLIFGNTVGVNLTGLMQDQEITFNGTGVIGSGTLGGTALSSANLIQANVTGINFTGVIQYNDIGRNTTAVFVQSNQLIAHNLFFDDNGPNLETNGAAGVEIVNNTFYSPNQNNIQVDGGSSNVQILNNILWTGGGYDLDLAGNSRSGFFSDYNDLYTTGSGQIVYYLQPFSDILDWQDDVGLYDLHSIGTTVTNPTAAQPQFVDLAANDFTVFPAAAGLQPTSPTISAGDPATDIALPAGYTNLLTNPGFENGVSGWTVNPGGTTQGSNPTPFSGTSYFAAGNVASGFAEQTILLSGVSAGNMDISFGGRIRAAAETPPDEGDIVLSFLNASGTVIGVPTTLTATNVNDRWELVSGRVHIPENAASVVYDYQSTRESGSTDQNYLDGAFLYVVSDTTATDMGAYGNTAASLAATADESIHIVTPNLYVNWALNQTHSITWATLGNTGDSSVEIQLFQQSGGSLTYLSTITSSTPDTGTYAWIPANSGLSAGTTGYKIEVSVVGNSAIFSTSAETFTIPQNGTAFYVNDSSTAGNQYTTAAGNNRATGMTPADPLPLLTTVFRTYSLGGTDTVYVDTGTYNDFAAVEISGNPAIGSGQGVTILGPTTTGDVAAINALGFTAPAVIDVNDGSFVTVKNLTLSGANYGLWVHVGSNDFVGANLTATGNLSGGVRIESDSSSATFSNVTTSGNTGDGFYAGGVINSLTNSSSFNNSGDGFDFANAGAVVLTGDSAYNNNVGLVIANSTFSTTSDVGNANLALGLGNQFYNNKVEGIYATGSVLLAGNTVFGQSATNAYGINMSGGVGATENIVYGNYNGIQASSETLTFNRVYNNGNVGIESDGGGTVSGNVVYGNNVGIESASAPNSATGPDFINNLVYNNTAQGIYLTGGNNAEFYNNTVYQPLGNAIRIDAYSGLGSAPITIENNILWAQSGYDLLIASANTTDLKSDYNDLYYTGTGAVGPWLSIAQQTLANWTSASGDDVDSISADPLFVNAAGGDFHEQSTTGSFHGGSLAPALGTNGLPIVNPGTLTADANESPAIDRGDPKFAYGNEPAPNGAYVNLGAFGNSSQASESPVHFLFVTAPISGQTVATGLATTISWRDEISNTTLGAAQTDTIDILQGSTIEQTFSAPDTGSYSWTPPTSLPLGSYTIKVIRNDGTGLSASSPTFTLAGFGGTYYVNGSSTGGILTTAGGNDANSGLDPAHPKADIAAILAAYTLAPGNLILVDEATYSISNNLVMTAAEDGITIEGVAGKTTLNRGNTNSGSYVFDFQGANNVTLENLSITGAIYGINASSGQSANGLKVINSNFYADENIGINLAGNNGAITVTNSTFDDMLAVNGVYGVEDIGNVNTITLIGNTAYGLGYGFYVGTNGTDSGPSTISNNVAYDNSVGIDAGDGSNQPMTVSGNISYDNTSDNMEMSGTGITVSGNTIYEDVKPSTNQVGLVIGSGNATGNVIYGNYDGIDFSGGGTATYNLVYNNSNIGIIGGNADDILGNVIYSNGLGISLSVNPSAAGGGPSIENNLLYGNTNGGISLSSGDDTPILNNTIYQTTGDALQIASVTTNNVQVRDNIFWVTSGIDIAVGSAAEQNVTIDYNDLYATSTGQIGTWNGVNYSTLAGWQDASGMDPDSISTDPLFVNAAAGDFHVQSLYGSFHGGSLAPTLGTSGLPVFNSGTLTDDANQSPTIDRGSPSDPYSLEPAPNGGYVNLGSYGNTAQASLSPTHYLVVVNPNGQTLAEGQPYTITWRDEISNTGAGASKTDTIDVLQGGTVEQTFSAPDTGSYTWTPPTSLPPGNYQIEVIRNDGTGLSATGGTFALAAFNGTYYVNGSSTGGVLTTAGGSDSNSGLDAAHPKATLSAIFADYVLAPGNVIMVDEATYNLSSNLVMTAADDGITIIGVPGATILNRGNLNSGAYVFDFQGATNVTLENLSITGAEYGINAGYQEIANGLTVNNCSFYADENIGIYLEGNNGAATITNSTFDNMLGANGIYGVESYAYANTITLTGNTAYGLGYGLDVTTSNSPAGGSVISNNTVYDNSVGIYADDGSSQPMTVTNNNAYDNYTYNLQIGGTGLTATGNSATEDGKVASKESSGETGIIVSGNAIASGNIATGNVIGINADGNATAVANQVNSNSSYGIEATTPDIISGNTIYSNGSWGIFGSPTTVNNNLLYANGSGGIYFSNTYDATIVSNTVYTTSGPAFRLDGLVQNGGSPPSITVQNNIFWATNAPDMLINDGGEQSFSTPTSDYNDLYATGTGEIGQVAGQNFATLAAWTEELGLDTHSISANPQFINAGTGNFHVQSTSQTIDAGNPGSEFIAEPQPNGGRINLGYDGDTSQAATSAATTVSISNPTSQQKLQVGVPTTISWLTTGLLSTQTISEVAAGETSAVGEYHANEFGVGSQILQTNNVAINTSLVTNPAPLAVYQTYAEATNVAGNTLSYQIPANNGTYTIRLDFVEPFIGTVGGRTFDVLLQGQTVQSAFDIYSAAGKVDNKAVALTFTVTASGGTGISLELKNDTAQPALLNGFEISAANAGGAASQSVNVQDSIDGGNTWNTIATNQPLDLEGRGSFTWTPTTQSNDALIRVVANNSASTTGTSGAFLIAPAGTVYYVANSTTTTGDVFATAVGNNANDGKTPATPMASIEAVLNTYQPGAGDVIEVDSGTYTLFHDIDIPAIDSGVTIMGPSALGGTAVENRNSTSQDDYVFDLFDGANNVTIENLSITGGQYGIYADKENLGNTNVTIANNQIYSNNGGIETGGIEDFEGTNWTITGNTVHDNSESSNATYGIQVYIGTAVVTNNTVYNEGEYDIYFSPPNTSNVSTDIVSGNTVYGSEYGIYASQATISNNIAHGNTIDGIAVLANGGESIVTGNTAYGQTATNAVGILANDAAVSGNKAYDNYIGMEAEGGQMLAVYDNSIYSNLNYGMDISAGTSTPSLYPQSVYNNLVYANSVGGIEISSSENLTLLNNTVYQLAGDAVNLSGTSNPLTIENNILWVQTGYDLDVTSTSSQTGLLSNYNILYHTGGNANVGKWNGTTEGSLAAWQTASSEDSHSSEANPGFVDPAGADAVLGYNASANNGSGYNGGPDDNFSLAAGSPAIASGLASVKPATDILGYARVNADMGAYAYRGGSAYANPATVNSFAQSNGQITVVFSQPPNDIDALAPSLYALVGAGPDGIFGTADDIDYTLTPAFTAGSSTVTLTITGGSLPPGQYQFTIFSNAASSIHNLNGIELDGDGNGTPGGNYVNTFTIGQPLTTSLSKLTSASIVYGTASVTLSGVISTTTLVPTGNVSITVNGTAVNAAINPSTGAFSASVATQNLGITGSPYTITYSYAGAPGFAAISDMSQTIAVTPAVDTWTGAGGDSNWNNPADWSAGVVPTANYDVIVPTGVTSLTIGTGTFAVYSLDSGSALTISGGSLMLNGPSFIHGVLTIQGGARLDITSNPLTIDYGTGLDPITAIQSYLSSGYAGGAWNGAGIMSSSVAGSNASQSAVVYSVGYADGADGITTTPSGEIQIMPTLAGDAKLQGNVVFGDFQLLSQYFGQTGTTWDEGNFTYGSTTNFGDFQLLSQNFGQSSKLAAGADAGYMVWSGAADGTSWSTPGNWSGDTVPTPSDTLLLPAGSHVQLGSGSFVVTSLTLQGNAVLDLGSATLKIHYGTNADPISSIQSYLASGYHGGLWNGSGIISSIVAGENTSQSKLIYSVGYADGADGITGTPSGTIEIMPTLAGDAKLQGNVVFGDFQLLSQYFGQSGTSWDEGNFTYGSTTNFGDFQLLSQNFGQASSLPAAASNSPSQGSFDSASPTDDSDADGSILDGNTDELD